RIKTVVAPVPHRGREPLAMRPSTNSRPARSAPPVVVAHAAPGSGADFLRLLPAVLVSAVAHAILFALLWFVSAPLQAGPPTEVAPDNQAVVQPNPDDDPKNKEPLGMTEDIDPNSTEQDQDIGYTVSRIAKESVPGTVNPNEPIGIDGA